jgi:hypothetical protein
LLLRRSGAWEKIGLSGGTGAAGDSPTSRDWVYRR